MMSDGKLDSGRMVYAKLATVAAMSVAGVAAGCCCDNQERKVK